MGSQEKLSAYLEKQAALEAAGTEGSACRQRIRQLLDEDSFVELDSLVTGRGLNFGFAREPVAGDGVVTGYGTIEGRMVYVAAQDASVYGGSVGQMHAEKISKAIDLANAAQVPFIGLYETGGARIDEGIIGLEGLGHVMASMNAASGEIPLLAGVFGPCAGGAAYLAALSDFVLMTKEKSGLFMNGPMVVSGVENKSIEAADIGGAAVHAGETGLASMVASDETDLIARLKLLLSYLPDSAEGFIYPRDSQDDPNRTDPRLDEIAARLDQGVDMREIIRSVMDTDTFLELSPDYAAGVVTGLARLDGTTVGVLANAAARLDSRSADKAVQILQICERFRLPVITLTNAEGYEISLAAEKGGLLRDGAHLMRAMLESSVPRLSLIVGKAIGTAYLTMSGKSCGTDMVYAWPTAEIAIVNADTAAHIIYRKEIAAAADPASARNEFVEKYASELASADVAAGLGHVDEVIRPAYSRPYLISALNMLTQAE